MKDKIFAKEFLIDKDSFDLRFCLINLFKEGAPSLNKLDFTLKQRHRKSQERRIVDFLFVRVPK